MSVIGKRLSTSAFTFDKSTMTFTAEASDLGVFGMSHAFLGQLYDDACDQGFLFVSERTGKCVPCYLEGIDYADELHEDIAGWRFKPVYDTETFNVLIIND